MNLDQMFPFRLSRKPSLWAAFAGRFLFTVVWCGGIGAFSYFVLTRGHAPLFVKILLGVFGFFGVMMLWDIVVRFWRTLTGKQPLVEIERLPLGYGESAQLRVIESDPESVREMVVSLVADHRVVRHDDNITVIGEERCYSSELLRATDLTGEPFVSMLHVQLPVEEPGDSPKWKVEVSTTLKQGGMITHGFPIDVRGR